MNPKPPLVEEPSGEADFIDEIAELLPAEQRPLWYRDMAHLRRLPADDEMLRIARALGFLAIVTRQTPAQIANEREQLAAILHRSVQTIQSARQDVVALHKQLEQRLIQLPAEISKGIDPQVIAAKLSESLRQQFVESGVPESAHALTVIAKQTRQATTDFQHSAKQLTDSHRAAANDIGNALSEMQNSIHHATETTRRAANELTQTFLREYKWSVLLLCSAALVVGFSLGILYYRWANPVAPEPTPTTVVAPQQSQGVELTVPATHSRKTKPTSKVQATQ